MNELKKCYGCGYPVRRGFRMITEKDEEVIICERCKRLWKKYKAEEERKTNDSNN